MVDQRIQPSDEAVEIVLEHLVSAEREINHKSGWENIFGLKAERDIKVLKIIKKYVDDEQFQTAVNEVARTLESL